MSDRLVRLRARMKEVGTDLVALGPTTHMRWLSGVEPHGDERPVMLLVSANYAGFLMPALNADAVRKTTDLPFETWADETGPDDALRRLLASCDLPAAPRVALDETMRADFALLLLDALGGPERTFSADTIGWLRARKDADEVAALKTSAQVNEAAMQAGFDALRPGISEREVADVIAAHYAKHDARPEFTIIGFGPNSAFPHHHTGETRLENDMAVLIDTGCRLDGYPSDMTRCGWFGDEMDPTFAKVAGLVEEACAAGIAAAVPGVRARDVDAATRGVIEAAGYGANFVHRTGHGLGLDVHEPPWITQTSETIIEPGMVFSVEPGIYLQGRFGVRIEDIVHVGDTSATPLAKMQRKPKTYPPT